MRCVTCKGRGLCGRPVCPILRRLEEIAALPKVGVRMEGFHRPRCSWADTAILWLEQVP